jgi:hypothetical protein
MSEMRLVVIQEFPSETIESPLTSVAACSILLIYRRYTPRILESFGYTDFLGAFLLGG